MEGIDKHFEQFIADAEKLWGQTRDHVTGGKSVKEASENLIRPLKDLEMCEKNELYFKMDNALQKMISLHETIKKNHATVCNDLRAFGAAYTARFQGNDRLKAEAVHMKEAADKIDTAKNDLVAGRLDAFMREKVIPMIDEIKLVNIKRTKATKLQYKYEQLQKLYEDETATKLLSAERTGGWVEKTKAELDMAKPDFFSAISQFATKFHGVRMQLWSVLQEERSAFHTVCAQSLNCGKFEPSNVYVDYSGIDSTLGIMKPHDGGMKMDI